MSAQDYVAVADTGTPVGRLSVAVSPTGLVAVGWAAADQLAGRVTDRTGLRLVTDPERTAPVVEQLVEYFGGARRAFAVAVDWRLTGAGSQRAVLQTLYETVGYGQSVTYGQLADRSPAAVPARGIGAIMGANPLPIIVPCHRVLARDGLGGYSGGSDDGVHGPPVKRWLLTLEGVLPEPLDWPELS